VPDSTAEESVRERAVIFETAQKNEMLARSQLDLYNLHPTNPARLEKQLAIFTKDSEIVDVPSGSVYCGADGFNRRCSPDWPTKRFAVLQWLSCPQRENSLNPELL